MLKRLLIALFSLFVFVDSSPTTHTIYFPIAYNQGHKAGIAWAYRGYAQPQDTAILNIEWYLNWAIQPATWTNNHVNYFACTEWPYGSADPKLNYWDALNSYTQPDYAGYLIFLNEPDLKGQCDTTPTEAVQILHVIRVLRPNAVIVGPNVSHMDYLQGWPWLRAFYNEAINQNVELPEIGGIHSYLNEPPGKIINSFFNLPYTPETAWVTEFGNCNPDITEQMLQTYLIDPRITRYAYYAPRLYMADVPTEQKCLTLFDGLGYNLTPNGLHFTNLR